MMDKPWQKHSAKELAKRGSQTAWNDFAEVRWKDVDGERA
jgi:hypothetical protein